ncbi:glycosyltransferase family A protein [Arthrobacter sp. STN4]|uniref:glycosyltransferase family 2 protein n=1 Tax=Arthrobacter sp. STN4 TaxID=2923276 RepID=UPI002119C1B4|nr:glycosyltransferase family A protein [Arthrobacter sp. STN4]MCQ9163010.1 glycosyltransferase family 2 protein [Arthrobacter sp. STN4]
MPQLSVMIPVKNGMPYLKSTIASTLFAMPRDSELLVMDDGSTDGTGGFLATVKDRRLKVFRNEESIGVAAAGTALLGQATGEHVARMDGDDICLPWRFSVERRALRGVDIVFSPMLLISARNLPFRPHLERGLSVDAVPLHLLLGNVLANPTMYGTRAALESLDGYQKTHAEDYDMWLRAAALGIRMRRIDALPTVLYRRHSSQLSRSRPWDRKSDDVVLEASFQALAGAAIGFEGSASTVLYNRPRSNQPYPTDPDIQAFADGMLSACARLKKDDRRILETRLRSIYRL